MASSATTRELSYRDAIREALAEEMRRDPRIVILGEDVGPAGGPFKTTEGLYEEFGDQRVMDMPIAENAFVGAALGMAITGMRPVVEIMFSDFLGVCADQIVNSIAKYRYMSGGDMSAPLVIRAIGGGGLSFGAQHSQTGESWFRVFPGLKIVTASDPQAAYTLLKASIRDENPVLFIEHKALLNRTGQVVVGGTIPPVEGARFVRPGTDVTVVASLMMVERALEAADVLAGEGVEAEVIDMQCLRPLDLTHVLDSVRKTNRLVTVNEEPVNGGWGSDVVAGVVAEAFDFLDGPPIRIGLPEAPLPFSPPLEQAAMPSAERIADAVRALIHGE